MNALQRNNYKSNRTGFLSCAVAFSRIQFAMTLGSQVVFMTTCLLQPGGFLTRIPFHTGEAAAQDDAKAAMI